MDDAMMDLMAGHGELRRRLGAYAEARLSPDLAASSRMRARVLAVAHRQAACAAPMRPWPSSPTRPSAPTAATRAAGVRRPDRLATDRRGPARGRPGRRHA